MAPTQTKYSFSPGSCAGVLAVLTSSFFLVLYRSEIDVVIASIFFTLCCATDTIKGKIPNLLNAGLIVAGICFNGWHGGIDGILSSLGGLTLGICLLLLFYLMGGVGAGDVKALGAVGALVGPSTLLHVFVYMGFFGGTLAVLHYLYFSDIKSKARKVWVSAQAFILTRDPTAIKSSTNSKGDSLRFPYATAIAFGYYAFLMWGEVL